MRIEVSASDDYAAQGALLEAFAQIGAYPDADFDLAVPMPMGLLPFRVDDGILTVFVDTWTVDLDGPDELVRRVMESMADRQ